MFNQIRAPFLAAAMLLCAVSIQADELLVNGGFETGDYTGWTQFIGSGTQSISTVNPSSGIYSANLNATADSPIDTVLQSDAAGIGQVSPGEPLTISFDLRGTAANGGVAFVELFSLAAGGGVQTLIVGGGPLFPDADPEVWTSYEFDVVAGTDVSGGVAILLKAACAPVQDCTSDFYFDNVSMDTVGVPDADMDSVPDNIDNCSDAANPLQEDADNDGYGNICDGDFDNSCGPVNFADLAILKAGFLTVNPLLDLDSSGGPVNFADLAIMKGLFLLPPGPSADDSFCNPPVDLAVNGGFETGDFTGWSQFIGSGSQSISPTNPSSGLFSANLNATAEAPVDTVIQMDAVGIGQVSPGDTVTVSFDVRGTAMNGGVAFVEFLSVIAGGGVTSQIVGGGPLFPDADPDVWTPYEFTLSAGADVSGGVSVLLKAACAPVAGCTSDLYFDNIAITN